MVDLITKDTANTQNELLDILQPVSSDLALLEEKLIENLSGNNLLLNKIIRYIIQAGGKRLRPAVTFLFAKALNNGFVSSNHFKLGQAVELIHTATLIHDDVIDDTELRRKRLTVNKKWDNKTAIIAGDFLLSKSLTKLAAIKNYSVIEIFASVMGEICEGEIQQNTQNYQFISIEQYIEKSKRKTANLFIAGTESAAMLTPDIDNLTVKASREYALNLGIAFQIVNDILNFTATEEEIGKPTGIDLQDGILTAPVLFALEEYEQKNNFSLKRLIEQDLQNHNNFTTALNLVLESNGIQKAQELAENYVNSAIESLNILPSSLYKESLIDLAYYIIRRRH